MLESFPPKSVVVGVDGSQAALRAARWAVDEVADTDFPLRLLYIRDVNPCASRAECRVAFEAGEQAVYAAYDAVHALGKTVKIEMEIIEGHPVPMLIQVSKSTPLICVGDTGAGQSTPAGFGSTATELIRSAHCSVAVVRGSPALGADRGRSVVAYVVGSIDDEFAVERGFQEAQRRAALLVLMMAWQSGLDDLQDDAAISEQERRKHAVLERYAAVWSPRYPGVTVRTVVEYGPFLNYLTDHADSIQLLVVGATQAHELRQLVSPAADPALRHSDFALVVAH